MKRFLRLATLRLARALTFMAGSIATISIAVCGANAGSTSQAWSVSQTDHTADHPSEDITRVIVLSPKAAGEPEATHAALLITGATYSGRISFGGRVQTVKQLRINSAPNPWESAWLVWNYEDEEHFYYVAIKPRGWEIGKRDPVYPGGQRFLASGEGEYPIGVWHSFMIVQADNAMSVRLNGVEIATYADAERPYTSGRLGLYSEDAEVLLDDVSVPFTDDFESYRLLSSNTDGFVLNNWFTPFLGHGYVAIVDRKK